MNKTAFLFAGQGTQKIGMGLDLYEKYPCVQEIYEKNMHSKRVKQISFIGPNDQLNDTRYAQSAIFIHSVAIAEVLKSYSVIPNMVAGLSLGELSALYYAGVYNFEDGLDLVMNRAQLMADELENKNTGMLALLDLTEEDVSKFIIEHHMESKCQVASINTSTQLVLSGFLEDLREIQKILREQYSKRSIFLNVSGAFHNHILKKPAKAYQDILQSMNMSKPIIPVVFNRSGKQEDEFIVELMTEQMYSTVLFSSSIKSMLAKGIDRFIEIGSHQICAYVNKIDTNVKCYSVYDVKSLEDFIQIYRKEL